MSQKKKNRSFVAVTDLTLKFLKKKALSLEAFFLFVLLIGFFCIFPPSLNYGDHASYGLIFQKNLINYLKVKSNYGGNFSDYVRNQYKIFHLDKLVRPDALDSYNLDASAQIGWITNPSYYSVYILSRLSTLIIFYLFLGKLNIEMCLVVFGLLVFIFTYIYAYKLGKLLLGRSFGIVLAVISVSNVYFNQLVRSMIAPFIVLYPLLFFASFYYLLSFHRSNNKSKWLSLFGLSACLAGCFLNGYSNTNVILLGLLAIFSITLFIRIKVIKDPNFKLLRWYEYGFVAYMAFFFAFYISALWSNLLGESIFYGMYHILNTRLLGSILRGKPLPNIYNFNFWQTPYIIKNTLQVLMVSSNTHVGPHEPGFLHDISFFNLLESAMFIFGVTSVFKKITSKRFINQLLLILFAFFAYRLVSNSANYLIVGRYTYDFYFITMFFSAYGLFQLTRLPVFRKRSVSLPVLYFVLAISLILNITTFNKKFIWQFEEGIKQSFGVYQLRQLYKNKISQDKNLFVYDFNRSNVYEYHIDLVTLLENKTDYETFTNFLSENSINSLASFKSYLENSPYQNIYLIVPVGLSQMGKSVMFEPLYNFHSSVSKFSPYFSLYKPYKTIRNRRGVPTFWVYKFKKEHHYYTVELDNKRDVYEIKLDGNERIDFIDFPGSIKKVQIVFDKKDILELDFNRFSFDRFHFSFDESSVVDIFNNFNYGIEQSNVKENDLAIITSTNPGGREVNFLEPQKNPTTVVFEYPIGCPIEKVYLNVPYIFYNDQFLNNEFAVSYRTSEELQWKLLDRQRSNGNLRYKNYDYYYPFESLPVFFPNTHFNSFSVIDPDLAENIFIQYKINSIYPRSVRPYSTYSLPEGTNNFLKFEVDTSKYRAYKKIDVRGVTLKLKFKEFQKDKAYNSLTIGTK